MIRLRSALASIYILALLAIAASAAAQAPEPNWELFTVPDEGVTASSGAPITRHLYILQNEAGINESPLPDIIKEDLLPQQLEPSGGPVPATLEEEEESVYAVSQEIVEGIVASESAGVLTPEIEAIAEPLDEEEETAAAPAPLPGFRTSASRPGRPGAPSTGRRPRRTSASGRSSSGSRTAALRPP